MAKGRNPHDIIDEAVSTGLEVTGEIYEVPAAIFEGGVQAALDLKDAVKKTVGLNPAKQRRNPLYLYRRAGNGSGASEKCNLYMILDPQREEEFSRWVRDAQRNPRMYRLVRPAGRNGKRNGKRNPQEDSERFYEKFHGEPSEQTVVVEKEFHEHSHLGGIGPLVECWIDIPTGFVACIQFPRNNMPILSSNEKGTQLYIEGGDQGVDLKKFGMDKVPWLKDRMILGTFAEPSEELEKMQREYLTRREKYKSWNITYQTRKSFDDFNLIDYQHDLGEPDEGSRERKEPPTLEFDPVNEQLFVSGGEYIIKLPVFGVSPGIEN